MRDLDTISDSEVCGLAIAAEHDLGTRAVFAVAGCALDSLAANCDDEAQFLSRLLQPLAGLR